MLERRERKLEVSILREKLIEKKIYCVYIWFTFTGRMSNAL